MPYIKHHPSPSLSKVYVLYAVFLRTLHSRNEIRCRARNAAVRMRRAGFGSRPPFQAMTVIINAQPYLHCDASQPGRPEAQRMQRSLESGKSRLSEGVEAEDKSLLFTGPLTSDFRYVEVVPPSAQVSNCKSSPKHSGGNFPDAPNNIMNWAYIYVCCYAGHARM